MTLAELIYAAAALSVAGTVVIWVVRMILQ